MLCSNGAGKTTLKLKAISRANSSTGTLKFKGKRWRGCRPPTSSPAASRATVQEGQRLFAELSVPKNLQRGLSPGAE